MDDDRALELEKAMLMLEYHVQLYSLMHDYDFGKAIVEKDREHVLREWEDIEIEYFRKSQDLLIKYKRYLEVN